MRCFTVTLPFDDGNSPPPAVHTADMASPGPVSRVLTRRSLAARTRPHKASLNRPVPEAPMSTAGPPCRTRLCYCIKASRGRLVNWKRSDRLTVVGSQLHRSPRFAPNGISGAIPLQRGGDWRAAGGRWLFVARCWLLVGLLCVLGVPRSGRGQAWREATSSRRENKRGLRLVDTGPVCCFDAMKAGRIGEPCRRASFCAT